MLEVYLVRHAQSLANTGACIGGRMLDTPLTALGETQAIALGEYFRHEGIVFDVAHVSPALRTTSTAQLCGQRDVVFDDRLLEIDRGRWTGKPYAGRYTQELRDRLAADAQLSWTYATPGGESSQQCTERVWPLIQELESVHGRRIAVSHRITIATIIRKVLNDDPRQIFQYRIPNTGISRLVYNGSWRVESIGETPHLAGIEDPGAGLSSERIE